MLFASCLIYMFIRSNPISIQLQESLVEAEVTLTAECNQAFKYCSIRGTKQQLLYSIFTFNYSQLALYCILLFTVFSSVLQVPTKITKFGFYGTCIYCLTIVPLLNRVLLLFKNSQLKT